MEQAGSPQRRPGESSPEAAGAGPGSPDARNADSRTPGSGSHQSRGSTRRGSERRDTLRREGRWAREAVQTRRVGNLSLLLPPPRPPASPLASCLEALQQDWRREGHLAGLWREWPRIAGPQLAPHCRPLQLQGGLLTVGAAPGPWLQALQYNRHQLLGALRGAGYAVRDVRVQQHHPVAAATPGSLSEAEVWALHPSRCDVHGLADCPDCGRPAPAGEMARWGHCSFCRRAALT